MRASGRHWSAILVWVILCLTEGAILRPYRRLTNRLAKADASREAENQMTLNNLGYPLYSTTHNTFQATPHRCCQIGERVAKKKMVCDITMLAVVRKWNYERIKQTNQNSNRPLKHIQRKRAGKLSEKIAKCSALHPKYFEKCCSYKEELYKHLKKCRRKSRRQRRRCKQIIRRRFV